ncbi:unnamed protein product, partial [Scytosiphon promiscuus]
TAPVDLHNIVATQCVAGCFARTKNKSIKESPGKGTEVHEVDGAIPLLKHLEQNTPKKRRVKHYGSSPRYKVLLFSLHLLEAYLLFSSSCGYVKIKNSQHDLFFLSPRKSYWYVDEERSEVVRRTDGH